MKARGLVLPSIAAFCALVVLLGLGTWQLERLAWKTALVAQVEARVSEPPMPAPGPSQWDDLDRAEDEYRPVTVRGRFDHAREVLIYTVLSDSPRPFKGPGFLVVTPLVQADGTVVLVNRGFVPEERRAPASRAAGQVEGVVTVTGLMRFPEEANWFVPENAPERNAWYRRDPEQIARAKGLDHVAPFTIDADAAPNPGGLPQGGETRLSFPNKHLEYALTWYGLAATLIGVYVAFVLTRLRSRPDEDAGGETQAEP